MSIKKKIGLAVITGAMGLTLIGGGTYAAFNDIETVNNSFAAGTLDLTVEAGESSAKGFTLENLKPGDTMTRSFELGNEGSLAIQNVLLHLEKVSFSNEVNDENDFVGSNDAYKEFLKQFAITSFNVEGTSLLTDNISTLGVPACEEGNPQGNPHCEDDEGDNGEGGPGDGNGSDPEPTPSEVFTLYDLYNGEGLGQWVDSTYVFTESDYDGDNPLVDNKDRVDLSALNGLDSQENLNFEIGIKFINDKENRNDDGLYMQNKFQNNSVSLDFVFEATQWPGIDIDSNGYVEDNGVGQQDK
ncbi:TasA family protein [Alkalibacillus haloalkaliphilus]|uniref:Spore coat-associated protein N n=1 Tax=Alkalibacillus haloalkaliphilus TaxID=94136 RepID=A0A511W1U9_9BACI|nr:TasA family protein [Alkalibacillus haloalkaliphilus]GEN44338.1 spore coat-associated protein N [Alkalibacillus haloalkaliphilus]